ncbi:unnamed protein product [Aphanomyces euteiches]|uniref:Endonuclease/exonuclease/phosphatase domain-containing protein n=1 Tax=Aphanomyces euteiches TaxID=100861 RepID=A0A6G0X3N1_9STRA|nr:hypothetical protein Ae201684_008782 [Aphanomyces euteiches]
MHNGDDHVEVTGESREPSTTEQRTSELNQPESQVGRGRRPSGRGKFARVPQRRAPTNVNVFSAIPNYDRAYTSYSETKENATSFRVVSFNVLADYLALSPTGSLAHSHPSQAWKYQWSFRRTRLLREILSWQAAIVCLQEDDHYGDYFEPELRKYGYVGANKQRTGVDTLDGCSIFVKADVFEIKRVVPLEYNQPGHAVLDRDNVALVLLLEHQASKEQIVVANTHILFNPRRGDVKLAQLQLLFETVESLECSKKILCGDFNLTPKSSLYEFISSGVLNGVSVATGEASGQYARGNHSYFHNDFHSKSDETVERHQGAGTAAYRFKPPTTPVRHGNSLGVQATHDLHLRSAYAQHPTDQTTGEPFATSYHDRFLGTVDYIWYGNVECTGVVEMPQMDFFQQIRALPTRDLGSDHLSLVADFALLRESHKMSLVDDDDLPSFSQDNNVVDEAEAPHELILDDPAETPPPLYTDKEPLKSAASSASSIYDYLDQVEMKSVQQLQLTASSAKSRQLPPLGRRTQVVWEPSPPPSSVKSSRSSQDNQYYAEIREKLVTLNIELQDKTQTIELLHAARKKDKAKAKEKAAQAEKEFKAALLAQKTQLEKDIEKQLDFAQTLVADKAELVKQCEAITAELKKSQERIQQTEESFQRQMKDAKERWTVQEKVKRDQWMVKKTEEIKKSTIKALEPDVQAIMTKCKENLDKARDAAADDKRKLIIAHEKEKDELLKRQREEYEKKLVEAWEKERSKLMYRLDAADAELQQQLNQQRRRLQDEAEKARNDLVLEMRALKLQHSRDLEDMRVVERQRIDHELTQLQKEKEELARRYDADAAALREKCKLEVDAMQSSIAASLRSEMEKEKAKWEAEMIKRRDEKIQMVIDKLHGETQKKVDAAEKRLAAQYELDTREFEKKLRAAGDIEAAWMEKNRELFDKCTKLEQQRDLMQAKCTEQAQALQAAQDNVARYSAALQEEREILSQERHNVARHVDAIRNESERERETLKSAVVSLEAKLDMMERKHAAYIADMRANHDDILEKLHARVRATVAKKDDMIETLREELHMTQVRVTKCEAIINQQREQLIA